MNYGVYRIQYYNNTGRDEHGNPVEDPEDDGDLPGVGLIDSPLNKLNVNGTNPLRKRHPTIYAHHHTVFNTDNWFGPEEKAFIAFTTFFSQVVEPSILDGTSIEIPPGCRPLWASCDKGGAYEGMEYLEICNYTPEKQTLSRREAYKRIWDMIISKLWELAGTERYSAVRDALRLDNSMWSGRIEWATRYPLFAMLSSYIRAYSWESEKSTLGVALYDNPPVRREAAYLKETWNMICGEFARS
ncbi:hypothetical protein TWF718_004572 [Orbilia javanica]|uniref:Uncharacterized protein n=1 Tax=Orbilia javanica TaxID=47235 RepID=A0AAN8N2X5_9PEZI